MVMALDPSYLAQADRHVAKLKALITDQEALLNCFPQTTNRPNWRKLCLEP
jgi:saccharopine dehydrogenase-like NADP-dependent oxidoreductase